MSRLIDILKSYLTGIYLPQIRIIDVVEIIIIALIVYFVMKWIKSTRAYTLLKGILIVIVFILLALALNMSTILWLVSRMASVALIAVVIIFQPELRKALESLGNRSILSILLRDYNADKNNLFSDKTITEIVRACTEMAENKTGALIVIEQDIHLTEFVETGIELDAAITSQLLINIFEKNTPLHDGAVIIRGDRAVAATCYLPLSENPSINKRLGTRHRAAIGISEVSDSYTIVISEETGHISAAYEGGLESNLTTSALREKLHRLQNHNMNERHAIYTYGKGQRQYYRGCWIEGTTDFIFGASTCWFEDCTILSKKNSYVTAASTPEGADFGYVFKNCRLIHDENTDKVYLGRPWRPFAKTVFIDCELGDHILKEGWHNWNKPYAEKTVFYAESGSRGPGAASAKERVKWSRQLKASQVGKYTPENVLRTGTEIDKHGKHVPVKWYFKVF